jgi:hypothetical protein
MNAVEVESELCSNVHEHGVKKEDTEGYSSAKFEGKKISCFCHLHNQYFFMFPPTGI